MSYSLWDIVTPVLLDTVFPLGIKWHSNLVEFAFPLGIQWHSFLVDIVFPLGIRDTKLSLILYSLWKVSDTQFSFISYSLRKLSFSRFSTALQYSPWEVEPSSRWYSVHSGILHSLLFDTVITQEVTFTCRWHSVDRGRARHRNW